MLGSLDPSGAHAVGSDGRVSWVVTRPHRAPRFDQRWRCHHLPSDLLRDEIYGRLDLIALRDAPGFAGRIGPLYETSTRELRDRLDEAIARGDLHLYAVPDREWSRIQRELWNEVVPPHRAERHALAAAGAAGGAVSISDFPDYERPAGHSPPLESDESLASRPGSTPEQIAARKRVATDFYKRHNSSMSEDKIESEVNAIDHQRPVYVVKIPPHGDGPDKDIVYQHSSIHTPNGVGGSTLRLILR